MRSRARFMASFIRTARNIAAGGVLALCGLWASGASAADCRDAVLEVERAMQDGLSDLAAGQGLWDEGLSHRGAAPGPDSPACRFLTNGRDAYRRALTQFTNCENKLERVLADCANPDWSALSASPQTCGETRSDAEGDLDGLDNDLSTACAE